MDLKELKLTALAYIDLQENLSEEDMVNLLNFVKKANEDQIYTLLISGDIQGIEEAESFIAESQDQVSKLNSLLEIDPFTAGLGLWGAATAVGALTVPTILATKLYKRFLTGMGRACAGRFGADLSTCRRKFKLNAKVRALTQAKTKCAGNRKCVDKMNEKISKARRKYS